jgi:diacylglycerol kinase (ATP)
MTTLGIVINPSSGRGKGKILGEQALVEFAKHAIKIIDLSATDFISAAKNARDAVEKKIIDGLVVVGGDGMFHLAVNAVASTQIPVGLIAAGTGNDSARVLGLPIHDAVSAVNALVAKIGNTRKVDLIQAKSNDRSFYSFGAVSAGFDALVNARANTWSWIAGPVKYRLAMYRELAAFKPISYRAVVDGVEKIFEAILCTIANSPAYGGGLLITPDAKVDDGKLDLFVLKAISRLELIKLFPKVYYGGHVDHPAVEIIRVESLELYSEGMPAYADGEHVGAAPVSCVISPKSLNVLA